MRRADGGAGLQYRQGGAEAAAGHLQVQGQDGHRHHAQPGADGDGRPDHHGEERHDRQHGEERAHCPGGGDRVVRMAVWNSNFTGCTFVTGIVPVIDTAIVS